MRQKWRNQLRHFCRLLIVRYMEEEFSLYLIAPGSRPPFPAVARYLWGKDDFDSDGNSRHPNDDQWTELTIICRSTNSERLDIDPVSENPLVLKISSTSSSLVQKIAQLLVASSGGTICTEWPNT